jgi:hypothetical protein
MGDAAEAYIPAVVLSKLPSRVEHPDDALESRYLIEQAHVHTELAHQAPREPVGE